MGDRELVCLVLDFIREMNALQRQYGPQLGPAREAGRMDAFLADYRDKVGEIYQRWLTERKRSYYKPLPDPPTFAAAEGLTLGRVEREGNRAAVELLTGEGCLDFRFMLLRKNGEWRINSYQQRYHSGYRVDQWSYGIF